MRLAAIVENADPNGDEGAPWSRRRRPRLDEAQTGPGARIVLRRALEGASGEVFAAKRRHSDRRCPRPGAAVLR